MAELYWYRGEVMSVYDGDTMRVRLDLGFGISCTGEDGKGVKIRLSGTNTPELRGGTKATKAKAREARDFVRDRVLGKQVLLHTIRDKTGKYGRYLAQVYELGEDGALRTELSLNQRLVDAGLAVAYMSKEEI